MKAWLCETTDGPDALAWKEVADPEPQPHEVRIAVRAASLNFPDLLIVQGRYQVKPVAPFVPGAEFAGTIDAVGSAVKLLKPGDTVAAFGSHGGFAEKACIDARQAMPLPAGFTFEEGASFIFTYGTAHHALADRGRLAAGETLLVLGAAGGVGSAAVQVGKALGARVIAAASSAAKCELCRSIGADATIDYSREDLRDALKRLTDGRGVDVVCDPVGGELAEPAFRSVTWRGRYLVVGFAAGSIPSLPLTLPLLKGSSIVGVYWGELVRREPQRNVQALAELAAWHARGLVEPVIDRRLPMASLREAYALMGSREVRGKLVLVND
jgi:NADPH2:quinone reductase